MKLAFCTTVRDRLEHLARAWPECISATMGCPDVSFTLVSFGDPKVTEWYRRAYAGGDLERAGRVRFWEARVPAGREWRTGVIKNLAHLAAAHFQPDVLVNHDADNYLTAEYVEFVRDAFTKRKDIFGIVLRFEGDEMGGASHFGRIAYRTEEWLRLGGYEEGFPNPQGHEDKDLYHRFVAAGISPYGCPNPGYIVHDHMTRVRPFLPGCRDNAEAEAFLRAKDAGNEQWTEEMRFSRNIWKANVGHIWGKDTLYRLDGTGYYFGRIGYP